MGKKIQKTKVKELFDLEIDEVSAVDKPAIGEQFYITKSVNKKNKGATVSKPVKKSVAWKQVISKGVSDENTHCVFCGITHEEEAKEIGMGLIKGVCFDCAVEHAEKGVFDACIAGTFDAETFQKENPTFQLKLSLNKSDDEEASEDGESEDESSSEDESEEESSEGDESEEESSQSASEDGEQDEDGQESDDSSLEKKVSKLEKNIEDVGAMLARSLELHDMAAAALNEIVALTFGALDGVMMLMEQNKDVSQNDLFREIVDSIKSEREKVSKKGAKISTSRMAVLRDIATKLNQLIASVATDEMKGEQKTKAVSEIQKSLEEMKEELKEEINSSSSNLKEDIEGKLKDMQAKLDELEQSGGASYGLGEEDDDEESDEESSEQEKTSIFSSVIGLDEISKTIEKKRRNLK